MLSTNLHIFLPIVKLFSWFRQTAFNNKRLHVSNMGIATCQINGPLCLGLPPHDWSQSAYGTKKGSSPFGTGHTEYKKKKIWSHFVPEFPKNAIQCEVPHHIQSSKTSFSTILTAKHCPHQRFVHHSKDDCQYVKARLSPLCRPRQRCCAVSHGALSNSVPSGAEKCGVCDKNP